MGQFYVNYSPTGGFTFHLHIRLSQETKSNKCKEKFSSREVLDSNFLQNTEV